jgi:hypothetical protein
VREVSEAGDQSQVLTVSDRLTHAGLSAERVGWWLGQEGGVWVDGEPVTDPATPAPRRRRSCCAADLASAATSPAPSGSPR